jgi:ATP-dependent Clp protease ATP-binding subunit ClpC
VFERFTEDARRVVVLSQREAKAHNHDRIGTEHVLLALTRLDDDGTDCGFPLAGVRARIEEIVTQGVGETAGHILFDQGAKRAFELSLRESRRLDHQHIGPEHILLGILGEGEGIGACVLAEFGAELSEVRRRVGKPND